MKFLTLVLPLFILLFSIESHGQEYLTMKRDQIKAMFNDWEGSLDIKDSTDFLKIGIDGNDKFIAHFFFNKDANCDSIHIDYYCGECVQHYLDYIFLNKKEKWIGIENNTYLSNERISWYIGFSKYRTSKCKQMTFVRTPEDEICATITFSTVIMESRSWKRIMKGK